MRTILPLFAALATIILPSCVGAPSVTRTAKGTYHATAGYTLLGKRENVIAEVVTREGDVIRYSTTSEDGTEVANTIYTWKGVNKGLEIGAPAALKGTKDPNIIPKDPNVIPKDPNIIPLDPNIVH